jgi:hypothetical protein
VEVYSAELFQGNLLFRNRSLHRGMDYGSGTITGQPEHDFYPDVLPTDGLYAGVLLEFPMSIQLPEI